MSLFGQNLKSVVDLEECECAIVWDFLGDFFLAFGFQNLPDDPSKVYNIFLYISI